MKDASGGGRTPATLAQLAFGMILFGTGTPISKLVTEHLPAMMASLFRVATAALVLLPFLMTKRQILRELSRRDWLGIGAIALFGIFGFTIAMFYGMSRVSGVVGSVVMSTTPAVTALGARLFLAERLGWRKTAAIVLAVAGVSILHLGSSHESEARDGLLLGSALVFGAVCGEAAYTLIGKRMSEKADPLFVAGAASLLALPLFLPFAVGELGTLELGAVPQDAWIAVAFWGAGTFGVGTILWYRGLSRASGATAAGFMGLMPISALLFSYLLLGEPFRWVHLAGFAVVLGGVALIAWDHARMMRTRPKSDEARVRLRDAPRGAAAASPGRA